MDSLDLPLNWLNYTLLLVQRLCVVVTAAFASIRLEWLRRALRGADTEWRYRLVAIAVFGLLGIVGTHSGFIFDRRLGVRIDDTLRIGDALKESEAIVGFRDSMVLAAGLIAGPWVGFGAGVVSGWERYTAGGFAAGASGSATVLIGIIAGLARRIRPNWGESPLGALLVALLGTILQRILVLAMVEPFDVAMNLAREISVPVTILNCLACVLFIAIVRDLDRERLEQLAHQAELRAWQARVEPHFLNNTLNAIKSLIRLDPDRARTYLVKLGEFFNETRGYAGENSVTLGQELTQLRRYLDFQTLRFVDALRFTEDVPVALHACRIPPRSLQTLVENALTHGFPAAAGIFELHIEAEERNRRLALTVRDNGSGITEERLEDLGTRPVFSKHGSGQGLYQLAQSLLLAFGSRASLRIESRPGAGTQVTLTLPTTREPW
ncbi:MAG: histidine kinase [Methylococcaceae bacterium]|nr:histidine kinase [Methylococcaceae bacterium]